MADYKFTERDIQQMDYEEINKNFINIEDYNGDTNIYKYDLEKRRIVDEKLDKNKEKFNNLYLIYFIIIIVVIFSSIYTFLYVMTDNISTVKFIIYFIGLVFLAFFLQFILNI